ncbi:MAG: phosphoribosylglycinamide formyltransferase, partial [Pseudomonadota bacterium]
AIPVLPYDTEKTLAARVLHQEHCIYPQAIRWFMEDRIKLSENRVEVINSNVHEIALYSPGLPE